MRWPSYSVPGLPVLLQRSFCPWQICLSMKEVLLSQALIPPGQVTSCGSILKTTRDHKCTAKEVRVDVAQQWNKHSSTHKAVVPTTHADTCTCAYKLTQAYMHTHTHTHTATAALILLSTWQLTSMTLSSLLYYSQSLELGKTTEGVGQTILERICLKVSAKYTLLVPCWESMLSLYACFPGLLIQSLSSVGQV